MNEQRERIEAELASLQKEYILEYLKDKLRDVATEVDIHKVMETFMSHYQQEFISNIVDKILNLQTHNRILIEYKQQLSICNFHLKAQNQRLLHENHSIKQQMDKIILDRVREMQVCFENTKKQTIENSKSTIQQLKKQLYLKQSTAINNDLLENQIANLRQKLIVYQKNSKNISMQLQESQQKILSTKEQHKILVVKVQEMQTYILNKNFELKARVQEIAGLQQSLAEMKAQIGKKGDYIAHIEQKNIQIETQIQALSTKILSQTQSMENTLQQLANTNQQLKQLQQQLSACKQVLQTKKQVINTTKQQLHDSEKSNQLVKYQLSTVQQELKKLDREKKRTEQIGNSLKEQNQLLRIQLEKIIQQISQYISNQVAINERNKALTAQNQAFPPMVHSLQTQLYLKQQANQKLQRVVQTYVTENEFTKKEINILESEMEILKRDKKNAEKTKNSNILIEQQLKQRQIEIQNLKRQIKALRVKLYQEQLQHKSLCQIQYLEYLEEIAQLKEQLKHNEPILYQSNYGNLNNRDFEGSQRFVPIYRATKLAERLQSALKTIQVLKYDVNQLKRIIQTNFKQISLDTKDLLAQICRHILNVRTECEICWSKQRVNDQIICCSTLKKDSLQATISKIQNKYKGVITNNYQYGLYLSNFIKTIGKCDPKRV